jgi:hypothetical protein
MVDEMLTTLFSFPELSLNERVPQHAYVQSCLGSLTAQPLAFVVADRDGFIIRSNYVSLRMRGCDMVESARDFRPPRDQVTGAEGMR